MIGYFFALFPLYLFVYLPISHLIWGPQQSLESQSFSLDGDVIALPSDEPLVCPASSYSTFILSTEPLIIYIENFLSANESAHLVKISEDLYEPSTIAHGDSVSQNREVRFSEVAVLPRDNTVRCIEDRARDFQGWRSDIHIERLRAQRYGEGGHYSHHYDWSGASRETDRVTTFMVYVDAACEGGGTEFPRLSMPQNKNGRWCDFLDCSDNRTDTGITFRPITGNAVFWVNISPSGRGYEETWHAGLPVTKGSKIGLNIWSWGSNRRR